MQAAPNGDSGRLPFLAHTIGRLTTPSSRSLHSFSSSLPLYRHPTTMTSFVLLCLALISPGLLAHAHPRSDAHIDARGAPSSPFWRRASVPSPGFYNPTNNGGSWLTVRVLPGGDGGLGLHVQIKLTGVCSTAASRRHLPSRPGRANKRRHLWRLGLYCARRPRGGWRVDQLLCVCIMFRSRGSSSVVTN